MLGAVIFAARLAVASFDDAFLFEGLLRVGYGEGEKEIGCVTA